MEVKELSAPLAVDVAVLWRKCFPCRELHHHIAWNPAGHSFTGDSIKRRILSMPEFRQAGSFVAIEKGHPVGFCLATAGSKSAGYISAICVAPRFRRQGLGSTLLAKAESYLKRRGVKQILTTHNGNPVPLLLGVPTETDALTFFLANNYRSYDRDFMQVMAQDTAHFRLNPAIEEMAAALDSKGIRISLAGGSDKTTLLLMAGKHFPQWRQGLADNFNKNVPDAVFVAVKDGAVMGFSGPYSISRVGTGHFACIGVAPEARGLGLGAVLFNKMCAALKAGGARTTHLTTNLHNPAQDIYAKAGYRARCVADCGMKKTLERAGK